MTLVPSFRQSARTFPNVSSHTQGTAELSGRAVVQISPNGPPLWKWAKNWPLMRRTLESELRGFSETFGGLTQATFPQAGQASAKVTRRNATLRKQRLDRAECSRADDVLISLSGQVEGDQPAPERLHRAFGAGKSSEM